MRKLIIVALALTSAVALNAQDVYKQTGGEQNLEFQFAPLGGSPIGISGIKYRKFTDANTAWRAEVFLGFGSTTDVTLANNAENTELRDRNSNFDISIAGGIEKHWTGTDRLSPYYGGVVSLGFGNTNSRSEFLGTGTDVEENTTKNGSLTVGLNALAGMDFYFADNIYLGAELGFGLAFTTMFDTVSESTVEGVDAVETPNGGSFNIGPNVLPRIRLGFLF